MDSQKYDSDQRLSKPNGEVVGDGVSNDSTWNPAMISPNVDRGCSSSDSGSDAEFADAVEHPDDSFADDQKYSEEVKKKEALFRRNLIAENTFASSKAVMLPQSNSSAVRVSISNDNAQGKTSDGNYLVDSFQKLSVSDNNSLVPEHLGQSKERSRDLDKLKMPGFAQRCKSEHQIDLRNNTIPNQSESFERGLKNSSNGDVRNNHQGGRHGKLLLGAHMDVQLHNKNSDKKASGYHLLETNGNDNFMPEWECSLNDGRKTNLEMKDKTLLENANENYILSGKHALIQYVGHPKGDYFRNAEHILSEIAKEKENEKLFEGSKYKGSVSPGECNITMTDCAYHNTVTKVNEEHALSALRKSQEPAKYLYIEKGTSYEMPGNTILKKSYAVVKTEYLVTTQSLSKMTSELDWHKGVCEEMNRLPVHRCNDVSKVKTISNTEVSKEQSCFRGSDPVDFRSSVGGRPTNIDEVSVTLKGIANANNSIKANGDLTSKVSLESQNRNSHSHFPSSYDNEQKVMEETKHKKHCKDIDSCSVLTTDRHKRSEKSLSARSQKDFNSQEYMEKISKKVSDDKQEVALQNPDCTMDNTAKQGAEQVIKKNYDVTNSHSVIFSKSEESIEKPLSVKQRDDLSSEKYKDKSPEKESHSVLLSKDNKSNEQSLAAEPRDYYNSDKNEDKSSKNDIINVKRTQLQRQTAISKVSSENSRDFSMDYSDYGNKVEDKIKSKEKLGNSKGQDQDNCGMKGNTYSRSEHSRSEQLLEGLNDKYCQNYHEEFKRSDIHLDSKIKNETLKKKLAEAMKDLNSIEEQVMGWHENVAKEMKVLRKGGDNLDTAKTQKHQQGEENSNCLKEQDGGTFMKNRDHIKVKEIMPTEKYHQKRKEKLLCMGKESSDGELAKRNVPSESDDDSDAQPGDSTYPLPKFTYTRLSWRKYIRSFKDLREWEEDCKDPFEQALAKSRVKSGSKEKFCRDLIPLKYHDIDDGVLRGWDDGDVAYIGELMTDCQVAGNMTDSYKLYSEERQEADFSSFTKGGARPKTYDSSSQKLSSAYDSNVEKDAEALDDATYNNFRGHRDRRVYGLEKSEIFEDELYTSDESKDDDMSYLQKKYDELMANNSDEMDLDDQKGFTPEDLVEHFSQCRNFTSDMQTVQDKFSEMGNIKAFIEDHPNVFTVKRDKIEFKPKICICHCSLTPEGCLDRSSCQNLHICDAYILNNCSDKDCINGHSLSTNHNRKVLKLFYMGKMESSAVMDVLQLIFLDPMQHQALDICQDYNFSKCNRENCRSLHICMDYVGGLSTCARPNCTLNHNFRQKHCKKVLNMNGIDIRDLDEENRLFTVISASPEIQEFVKSYGSEESPTRSYGVQQNSYKQAQQTRELSSNGRNARESKDNKFSNQEPSHHKQMNSSNAVSPKVTSEFPSNVGSASGGMYLPVGTVSYAIATMHTPNKTKNPGILEKVVNTFTPKGFGNNSGNQVVFYNTDKKQMKGDSTVWAHYPVGNVEIPEICHHSLTSVCKFESSGCKRLHAQFDFHWQYKPKRVNDWINFQIHQVKHLEQNFCNPYEENIRLLPPVQTVEPRLVYTHLSHSSYYVNFQHMKLINVIDNNEVCELRRLEIPKSNSPRDFFWYFKDDSGSWVQYGSVDTLGRANLATKITSSDIEKRLQKREPLFHFKNKLFDYVLDFKTMTQRNKSTGAVREVRRRPRPPIHIGRTV